VTRGLTPSNRVGLPHTEEAAVSRYAPLCLPSAEPDHLVSHLILKSDIRKISLSWSPVTESNRRSSPYHACQFRPIPSGWVGLPQVEWIAASGYVALCRPLSGGVVTLFVTGSRTSSLRNTAPLVPPHPGRDRTIVA